MNEKGLLLVISGPSGVGKGTIVSTLLKDDPELRLAISATTRSPRMGEKDGVCYRFFNLEEFEQLKQKEQLLEWAYVYGNYYGTDKQYVLESLKKGRNVLLEIDVQGALEVKEKLPGAVLVFVTPPSSAELRQRLEGRATDSQPDIERRLASFIEEVKSAQKYDYIVINDDVSLAAQKIRSVITAEKLRPCNQNKLLSELITEGSHE